MQKFKIFSATISLLVVSIVLYLLVSEWHPAPVERVDYKCEAVELPDTLTLVSWNIGYAGLGDDMDFFYDGGARTRTTQQRAAFNLDSIVAQLKGFEDADFILLQEVDVHSKRSYYTNQVEYICDALDYPYSVFAPNYDSWFVPIPLGEPMGRVKSGLLVLSRYPICSQIRRQYPTIPSLPNRLFDLKRCMLSVGIKRECGDTLWINNTHNTAFDGGGMRLREVEFISRVIEEYPLSVTAGDWNSTPPGYTPSREAVENIYFSPYALAEGDFPINSSVVADFSEPSVRYLDRPYEESKSITTLVDFAVLGTKCRIINYKIFNFYFEFSDHNPFIIRFLHK